MKNVVVGFHVKFFVILSTVLCALSSISLNAATRVRLQQATATFSQSEYGDFPVGRSIDGTTADGLGWGIYPEMGSAQTAAYQTTSDIGYADGSILTFKLDQSYFGWGQHLLGRFRISVTTDDRSTFCDGLATGGNVTANWTVLDPLSFTSVNGTTLTNLPDGSLLASGALPDTDVYTVTAATTLIGITGIRLEALTDPSFPNNGPGRFPFDGDFILSEFTVDIEPQSTVPVVVGLQQPTATFSQSVGGDFSVGTTINGTAADGSGWAIYPQMGTAQTAAYQTTSNIGYADGSLLTFTLDQSFAGPSQHLLGRFRISVTTDDRSTFCDGLATGGNVTANWTVIDPIVIKSANGTTLTELSDHSILASGPLPDTDVYTVKAQTTLTGITGIRLEALTEPSLPNNGPGRQPLNGNFVLSEFTVTVEPQSTILEDVGLQKATATFSQSEYGDFSVAYSINGTAADGLGWAIYPQMGTAQTAAYQTTSDIGYSGGSLLTFTLNQRFYASEDLHLLGRFRISVTTDDRSTFCDGLPTGGNVTANWTVLEPISVTSANVEYRDRTKFIILPDRSILVRGALPYIDDYTVKAHTTLTGITGIRLEALPDPSLPFNGPGRQPLDGTFILSEFSATIEPQSTVPDVVSLQQATATFSQTEFGDFSVAHTIDGTAADGMGWAIYPQMGAAQTAAYETTSNIGYADGSLLTFTLDQSFAEPGQHLLGRFRVSVTTDDRSTFCDGLATGGNVGANWTVLDPIVFTSFNGTTLSKLSDHSILASGALPDTDVYTVKARTTLTGITGIRLEALTDPSLPNNGPGRQPVNGNFVLSEFTVAIDPDAPITILADTPAESDVEAAIANASDGDTVLIRPGTASWDHRLTIGKAISVIGSGVPATTIFADPAFNPSDYALMAWSFDGPQTNLVRIAGIMFDCSSNLGAGAIAVFALTDGTVAPPIEHPITAFRIDDCIFNYGSSSIHTLGYTYGVIDHCNFTNNNRAIFVEGDNQFAWNRWEAELQAHQTDTNFLLAGTTRCVCIEDSNFTFDDNWPGSEPVIYEQNGARMTLRYSIFDARAYSGTNFIFIDAQGNFGERRGTILNEIYDTSYYSLNNARSTVFRGGSIIAYEDYMIPLADPGPSGFTGVQLTEEEGHACSFGPPWLTSWPANDQITNSFFWSVFPSIGLGYDGGPQEGCDPGTPDNVFIQEGRDYWMDQPQPGQMYYPYNGLIYPHPLVTDPPFLL